MITTSELSLLRIHNLALNGGFALAYLEISYTPFNETESIQKAVRLSKDGIEFCDMLIKGENIGNKGSELEIWEFMQILKKHFHEELPDIIKQTKEIKSKLSNLSSIKPEEIPEMMYFFNRVGQPFLAIERRR